MVELELGWWNLVFRTIKFQPVGRSNENKIALCSLAIFFVSQCFSSCLWFGRNQDRYSDQHFLNHVMQSSEVHPQKHRNYCPVMQQVLSLFVSATGGILIARLKILVIFIEKDFVFNCEFINSWLWA